MSGYRKIQDTLVRIMGVGPLPNHGAFWRNLTRDEFVAYQVYGLDVVRVGDPDNSNLVHALRGRAPFGTDLPKPPTGAIMRRMPAGRPPASEEYIVLIEDWIAAGCPESGTGAAMTVADEVAVDEDSHVRYWRAVDHFFHPSVSSPTTGKHVNLMHVAAFQVWQRFGLEGEEESVWTEYLNFAANHAAFEYIRHHQRRFIEEFYGGAQGAVFDSLWNFGGNLLPEDPLSNVRPEHTMNGVSDWFWWVPHLDATLRAADANDVDLALARGWQVGIVADGLLRTDPDRSGDNRMPILDFNREDPKLRETVEKTFAKATPDELRAKMTERARQWFRKTA